MCLASAAPNHFVPVMPLLHLVLFPARHDHHNLLSVIQQLLDLCFLRLQVFFCLQRCPMIAFPLSLARDSFL